MNNAESDLLTLSQYTRIAKKIISSWISHNTQYEYLKLFNDETIGYLINALCYADQKYDPTRELSRYKFRRFCAIRALYHYVNEKTHNKKIMLYFTDLSEYWPHTNWNDTYNDKKENYDSQKKLIHFLMNNAGLTTREKKHIKLYLEDKTFEEIGQHFQRTAANAYNTISRAIKKMRGISKKGEVLC